jgi:DNA-binding MarR family transcriptional regulator
MGKMTTEGPDKGDITPDAQTNPSADLEEDRFSPQYLLNLLVNVGGLLATVYDRRSPLTRQQTRLVGVLLGNDGQTQTELANALQIHKVSVGIYINELEKFGLVERRQHPTDRRAKCIYLTPLLHSTKHIGINQYGAVHRIATAGVDKQDYLNMLDCIELMRANLMIRDSKDREELENSGKISQLTND